MSKLMKPTRPRLYGRSKGRPLRPAQLALMDELYPQISIDPENLCLPDEEKAIWMEIGFGGGEHLIWQARENPDTLHLGAEPFLNGVAKALTEIDTHALDNVRLYNGDAREILDALPDNRLDRLSLLFPDPWPKSRHNKRRIVTPEFLSSVHRVLCNGSEFRFASDIIHYVDWTLTRVSRHGGFVWMPSRSTDWRERSSDWPGTRYEAKAIKAGRSCHYFKFKVQK